MSKRGRYWRRQLMEAAIAAPIIAAVVVLWHSEKGFGCVIGGVVVLLGLVMIGQTLWMSHFGRIAQGTVVDHKMEEGCFVPVVEFRDHAGTTRRERTDFGRGVRSPAVDSRVVVMYDPRGKLDCQESRTVTVFFKVGQSPFFTRKRKKDTVTSLLVGVGADDSKCAPNYRDGDARQGNFGAIRLRRTRITRHHS